MDAIVASVLVVLLLPILASYFQQAWSHVHKSLPPSPSWALPGLGHLHRLGRMPHQSLQMLAKKHGSIIFLWLGSVPAVVVSSESTAIEVLKNQDVTFASRPFLVASETVAYGLAMALSPYGDHWKTLRKLYTLELFTPKRIDSFLWIRQEELSYMLTAVKKSKVLDMRKLLTSFTFNAITRILMSKRYFAQQGEVIHGAPDPGEAKEFLDVLMELVEIALQFHISEFVPSYLRWIDWSVRRMRRLHVKQDRFLQKIVDEHKQGQTKVSKKDFVDLMLELLKDDPKAEGVVKAALTELFVGGTDTGSTTMEWALAEMLYNAPKALERAQEELDAVVGTSRMVEESDIPNLTYFQAIIKETFRLHPPVPLLVPHMAVEACNVAGYHVPKGSTTIINVYAIGRDPELWDEPLKFRPERFLTSDMDVKGQDFGLLPFGSGRRQCPGMGLGLKTIQLALANLIHGFNWKAVEERESLEERGGAVIWLKNPLHASASPRLPLTSMNGKC